jgi:hypothetical protein
MFLKIAQMVVAVSHRAKGCEYLSNMRITTTSQETTESKAPVLSTGFIFREE